MPAFVQQASGNDSNGSAGQAVATFGSATTNGNAIIVIASATDNSGLTFTVTDNKGNTYAKVFDELDPDSFCHINVWIAHNITGGASHAVTSAISPTGDRNAVVAIEVSGLASQNSFDRFASNPGQFSTTPSSGDTPTLQEADEFVVGIGFQTTSNTLTVGSGYSNFVVAIDTSGKLAVQSKVVAATTAVSSIMGGFQSNNYSFAAVVTFSETEISTPYQASVSPVVITATVPAVTAQARFSASASPVVITASVPAVTATYIQVESAAVSPMVLTFITPTLRFGQYSREATGIFALPSDDADLSTIYSDDEFDDVAADDDVRVSVTGSKYVIHQFEDAHENNTDRIIGRWVGQSNVAPSSVPVVMQVYNHNSDAWETVDTDASSAADTDFELTATISANVGNYYGINNVVAFRIYQG